MDLENIERGKISYKISNEFKEQLEDDFMDFQVLNLLEFKAQTVSLTDNGFTKENSRLVFSVCPDDVNRIEERESIENCLRRRFNGEFHLGGLGAYPMGGVSGITAASHHPPDKISNGEREDGNLIFFLSPHMGLIKQDDLEYGKIIRPGQEKITSSCGAMMGFLAALKESGDPANFYITPDDNDIDPTRIFLHNDLIKNYSVDLKKILENDDPNAQVVELFKLNCKAVKNKLDTMIQGFIEKEKDHFNGSIAVINGITVNLREKDAFLLKDITFPK